MVQRDVVAGTDVAEGVVCPDRRRISTEGHDDHWAADHHRADAVVRAEVADGGNGLQDRATAVWSRHVVRGVDVDIHTAESNGGDAFGTVPDDDDGVMSGLDGADDRADGVRVGYQGIPADHGQIQVDVDARLGLERYRLERRGYSDLARVGDLVQDRGDRLRDGADRTELRVEVDRVAVEDLGPGVCAAEDGAAIVGDEGLADGVPDVAVDGEVEPGGGRLSEALDDHVRGREDVLDVEGEEGVRGRVRAVVQRNADDGFGVGAQVRVQGVDGLARVPGGPLDEDALVGGVADQDRVPGLLQVEDAIGAVDVAEAERPAEVRDLVGLEQRRGKLVVDDRVNPDGAPGDGVADVQGRTELGRADGHVVGLGDDLAGGVDDQDRVGLAEQVDGGLPCDVPLCRVGDSAFSIAEVEESAGAVCMDVEAIEVLECGHIQFRRANH